MKSLQRRVVELEKRLKTERMPAVGYVVRNERGEIVYTTGPARIIIEMSEADAAL